MGSAAIIASIFLRLRTKKRGLQAQAVVRLGLRPALKLGLGAGIAFENEVAALSRDVTLSKPRSASSRRRSAMAI
jgi:hypothetical protein